MKEDDELKEFLGRLFSDFESDPAPEAWQPIQEALSKAPRTTAWPKIVTGVLVGVLYSGICHAPVHSQLSITEAKTKSMIPVTNVLQTEELLPVPPTNAKIQWKEKRPLLKKETIGHASSEKLITITSSPPDRATFTPEEIAVLPSVSASETAGLGDSEATQAFQPECLTANKMKELPGMAGNPRVTVWTLPQRSAGALKLWSVSVMPLATYQRMYVLPEANDRINRIHGQQSLNGHRTGLRVGTELTLLRDRSAWRFGVGFTQMRQRLIYSLSTDHYTLSTSANPGQPTVSQQTAQAEEVNEWHLLGIRADRQYQWATNGRQRYFVSIGTEGAVDLAGRQPYLWGHLSAGVQKLLTPHVWMSVEPTASYSLIGRTAPNGLLRINPYNFGVKVSVGMIP